MKKILYIALGFYLSLGITIYAATVFNSNQVGTSPVGGYILTTNGSTSNWTATTTFSTGLSYSNGVVTNTGVTSLSASSPLVNNVSTGAVSLTFDLTAPNSFTGLQTFLYSSTSRYSSFVTASSTNLFAGLFTLSTSTAGCLSTNGTGLVYAKTCGSGTVTSVATDSTLNGGTITTIGTLGLNLSNPNTWSGLQQFNANASSTIESAYSAFFGGTATTTITNTGNVLISTSTPWLNSALTVVGTTTISGQFSTLIASSSAVASSYTVDWSSGNTQRFIVNQTSAFIINATSSNPLDGGRYTLKICQDNAGGRTVSFATPAFLRWWNGTTTVASTANKCTYIGMIYDSTYRIYSVVASSTNVDIK